MLRDIKAREKPDIPKNKRGFGTKKKMALFWGDLRGGSLQD